MKEEYLEERRQKSARHLQMCFRRYRCRQVYYVIWVNKRRNASANNIQRVWRGTKGRAKAVNQKILREEFFANALYCVKIQRNFRGHRSINIILIIIYMAHVIYIYTRVRRENARFSRIMREMYFFRSQEAEAAIAVRVQSSGENI